MNTVEVYAHADKTAIYMLNNSVPLYRIIYAREDVALACGAVLNMFDGFAPEYVKKTCKGWLSFRTHQGAADLYACESYDALILQAEVNKSTFDKPMAIYPYHIGEGKETGIEFMQCLMNAQMD